MKKSSILFASLALAVWASVPAMADDTVVQPNGTTVFHNDQANAGGLKNEAVGIKPQVGVLGFNDRLDSGSSRLMGGLTLDVNLAKGSNLFVGPSTGILVANLGSSGSNFFGGGGSTPVGSSSTSSWLLMIPVNAMLGANIGDNARIAVHGGGNVIRNSNVTTVDIGGTSSVSDTGSAWTMRPNVGADLEFGGRSLALFVRPDVTFASGTNIYTATIGLDILAG